jgi:hypothetical protein
VEKSAELISEDKTQAKSPVFFLLPLVIMLKKKKRHLEISATHTD